MRVVGLVAAVLMGVIAVLQIAVALGAPLGRWSWGGQHEGVLPRRFRIASGFAGLVLYPALALMVLDSAGLVDSPLPSGSVAMWALTGFFGLGTVANALSRSKPERIWAPVSLTIAVCCAVLALNA